MLRDSRFVFLSALQVAAPIFGESDADEIGTGTIASAEELNAYSRLKHAGVLGVSIGAERLELAGTDAL